MICMNMDLYIFFIAYKYKRISHSKEIILEGFLYLCIKWLVENGIRIS